MERVGWIGTGIMGSSMCRHLQEAGYPVTVYNRTKAKAGAIIDAGATWVDDPAAVAAQSDVVFTILGYPRDVEEVYLGEGGLLFASEAGTIFVDMTTSEPSLAQRIAEAAAERGCSSLDAPVSGGDVGARNGTLAIMVGGPEEAFDAVRPMLDHLGENISLLGPPGAGQHTKCCNQTLVAGNTIGMVESLLYGYKAGLDLDQLIDVIGKGAASSWVMNNMGRRIAKGDFDPGFMIKHFVKDMGIVLREAEAMNLALPGLSLVNQFYLSAMALGWENLGHQGLYRILARMNGMESH
ncbi:MAG: NAD(P)-dependent oxidoreductase [Spirochaetaceae bacterium]